MGGHSVVDAYSILNRNTPGSKPVRAMICYGDKSPVFPPKGLCILTSASKEGQANLAWNLFRDSRHNPPLSYHNEGALP